MKKIGFIGLGNMGKGMSMNLSEKGHHVLGFDINEEMFKKLKNSNVKRASSIEHVTNEADIIITMLPDGTAVRKVWKEIFKYSKNKQYLIDCSTIDVKTSLETQKEAKEKNLLTLDAPVSGGVIGADNGTLTFMVGGDINVYNEMGFLFNIMGKNSILCGEIGAGQSAKICNNMLLATTMIAVGESFELGKNLGLNLSKLYDVLSTSSGSCWAINTYCPIKGVGPKSPSDQDYKGGFSADLMFKDLGLAIQAIKETQSKGDYTKNTHKKFERIVKKGKGKLDFSNVINESE